MNISGENTYVTVPVLIILPHVQYVYRVIDDKTKKKRFEVCRSNNHTSTINIYIYKQINE